MEKPEIIEINARQFYSGGFLSDYTTTCRLNNIVLAIPTKGEALLCLDNTPHRICKSDLIIIMPTHLFSIKKLSLDFEGQLLILSNPYWREMDLFGKHPFMVSNIQIRKDPCIRLTPDEMLLIKKYWKDLQQTLNISGHTFRHEILMNLTQILFWELANMIARKEKHIILSSLTQSEILFEKFLKLLSTHCKKEHQVRFYADKLFITQQYLSTILKKLTGKTGNVWINNAVAEEARILLHNPYHSIQEIADMLYFSDQSSFSKFFKRLFGMTPTEYRIKKADF